MVEWAGVRATHASPVPNKKKTNLQHASPSTDNEEDGLQHASPSTDSEEDSLKHASPLTDIEDGRFRLISPVWRIAEGVSLGLVLFLAGVLRLGWPGANAFLYDEARVSLLALQMAHGAFVSVGMPSSTAMPNMPGFVWLMVPLFRISSDPLFATLAIGLANTLAVAGVWWLARRAWGPWAGLCAALLLAGSPWSVFFNRSISGQNLLAPMTVVWALGAYGASRPSQPNAHQVHGKHRLASWLPDIALFTCVFVACFAPQVHYAGLALIPATLLVGLRFRWWQRWKAVLTGIVLAGVCALPFTLALLRDSGMRGALGSMLQTQAQYDLTSLRKWAELGLGLNWKGLFLNPSWVWSQQLDGLLRGSQIIVGVLGGLGLGVLVWQTCRQRHLRTARLAALGLAMALLPPLLFIRHSTPALLHYQLVALPALFLGAGALAGVGWCQVQKPGARGGFTWLRRSWGPIITLLALGVALVQAVALGQAIDLVLHRSPPGGLGTPLYYPRAAIQTLRAESRVMGGAEIIVLASGDDPAFLTDPAIFSVLLWNAPHRIVDGSYAALLIPGAVGSRAIMLSVLPDMAALDEARAAGLVTDERSLPRRIGESPYITWEIAGEPQGYQTITPQALANGAVLMGWRVRRVGDMLRLSTWWQLKDPLIAGDYHQFNHLYSANGQKKEGQDRPLSSHAWRAGDKLITWADFALPQDPGAIWFDVGMYAYPSLERVAVQDPANTTASIRLGPLDSWD